MLQFGHVTVSASQIFLRTTHCVAFVNISPVTPGHMLVAPMRSGCVRVKDMEDAEAADLMQTSAFVSRCVERAFGSSSTTFAIQDGIDAGQTIAHVHTHVIPRRKDDFAFNDAVYDAIEKPKENRKRRSEEEMEAEAVFMSSCIVLEQRVLDFAIKSLDKHFAEFQVDAGHGIDHAEKVLAHCARALAVETTSMSPQRRMAVLLASLLHDADDRKFFGENASLNLIHAQRIASESLTLASVSNVSETVDLIKECIGLVSASKNKNSKVNKNEEWKLIPRFSDRLEAIGWIGVVRCYTYNKHIGASLFVESTPRVTSVDELDQVAPMERFLRYSGESDSFIDHFYDKLVHVTKIESENSYFVTQATLRRAELLEFLFEFGRTGKVNEANIHM